MARLLELLHAPRRPGYPADYLLARLPARRALWRATCPAGAGEESWRELERELEWLHGQLDSKLRRDLAPALLYFELPHLLAALRFGAAGEPDGVAESLGHSRLAAPLRELLVTTTPFPAKLRALGEYLAGFDPALAHLEPAWRDRGQVGLEQVLLTGIQAATRREHPTGPVREFLERLWERQGLLRQAKAARWQWAMPEQEERPRRRLPSSEAAADPAVLDRLLLRELTRDWRRKSRTGGQPEQVLDYLWTCYLSARDCGVRSLERLLGEERVKEETIL